MPLGDGRYGGLERIHLEEDAGKTTHTEGGSLVDLNRAGVALIEIVGLPDLHTPADAHAFLTELKQIMQYAGISECDMEKGALDHEEFPRPQTTLEGLAALQPAFAAIADYPLDESGTTYRGLIHRKYPDLEINHVHHAGNSSGVVDGAAAVLLASPEYAKANGLKPRARIVAMCNMGDSPTLMLNAPVPAARKVLEKAGLDVTDIDLFEINEAFSVVTEKFIRDLNLDRDKVNVNGGAMALGHPIGATGSVLIGTIVDELERADKRLGLVTMCAAGGMAPAIIVERM